MLSGGQWQPSFNVRDFLKRDAQRTFLGRRFQLKLFTNAGEIEVNLCSQLPLRLMPK